MKPRIRRAGPDDLNTLVRVDQACFPKDIAYGKAEFAYYLGHAGTATHVAEADGKVLGFSVIACDPGGDSGTLITLDVLPGHRRGGVGSVLLSTAERWLASNGIVTLRLQVDVMNHAAIAFYARFGFRKIGLLRNYYGQGRNAYLMQKSPI